MDTTKRWIKFQYWPTSWGLTGDDYTIAEARYYLGDGEELDRRLATITLGHDPFALARAMLTIDLRYHKIDDYTYQTKLAELEFRDDPQALLLRKVEVDREAGKISEYEAAQRRVYIVHKPGLDQELALLDVERDFGHMSKHEYEKKAATARDEPWIAIINSGFNPEKGIDGVFFEFDWNPKWIEFLKLNGYVGQTDEQVVDDWFSDVCRSHTAAEMVSSMIPTRREF
jgi:hypothetical protein